MRPLVLTWFLVLSLGLGPAPAFALRQVGLEEGRDGSANLRAALTTPSAAAGSEERNTPVKTARLAPADVRIWVVTSTAERAFVATIRRWLTGADDARLRRISEEQVEAIPVQSRASGSVTYQYQQASPKPTLIVITYDLDFMGAGGTGIDVAQAIPAGAPTKPRPDIILVSPYNPTWPDLMQSTAIQRVLGDKTITAHVRLRSRSREQDLLELRRVVTTSLTARLAAGAEEQAQAKEALVYAFKQWAQRAWTQSSRVLILSPETVARFFGEWEAVGRLFQEPTAQGLRESLVDDRVFFIVSDAAQRQRLTALFPGAVMDTVAAAVQHLRDRMAVYAEEHETLTWFQRYGEPLPPLWQSSWPTFPTRDDARDRPRRLQVLLSEWEFATNPHDSQLTSDEVRRLTDALLALTSAGMEEPGQAVSVTDWPATLQAIADRRDTIRAAAQALGSLDVDVQETLIASWRFEDPATQFAPRPTAIERQAAAWLGIPVHLDFASSDSAPGTLRIVRAGHASRGWTVEVDGLRDDQRLPDEAIAPLIVRAFLAPDRAQVYDVAGDVAAAAGPEDIHRTLTELFT